MIGNLGVCRSISDKVRCMMTGAFSTWGRKEISTEFLGSVDISPRNRPNWLISKNFPQEAVF